MGNQASHEKQSKADNAHIKSLLDRLTVENKGSLLKHFSSKDGETYSKPVDITTFNEHCVANLHSYYDKNLAQAFGLYVIHMGGGGGASATTSSITNAITLRQCLDAIQSFSHGTTLQDGTILGVGETFLLLYTLVARQQKTSLKSFVSWIVATGVRIWFEGSGRTFVDDAQQQSRLVSTLFYFTNERKRQTEQMDWLLDDDNDTAKQSKEEDVLWTQMIRQEPLERLDDDLTKQKILSWFEGEIGLMILLRLVANAYFFGDGRNQQQDDDVHQARISHQSCPSIQAPPGDNSTSFSHLLSPYDYFYLSLQFPQNALSWSSHERMQHGQMVDQDLVHQQIFSSRQDGNSWQVFVHGMVTNPGATLLVIKTKDGSIFGGYADDTWRLETDWYGTSSNFLYQLDGNFSSFNMLGLWNATSNNRHYQYLCWGKSSLPNGLGMGGQLDYAGLWIDADFIHGHSKGPTCSTYQSPQLSLKSQFEIDEVEVWLVRPAIRDEDEDAQGGSVLDRAEDMEFLEMSGKKLYSRDLEKPPTTTEQKDDEPPSHS